VCCNCFGQIEIDFFQISSQKIIDRFIDVDLSFHANVGDLDLSNLYHSLFKENKYKKKSSLSVDKLHCLKKTESNIAFIN